MSESTPLPSSPTSKWIREALTDEVIRAARALSMQTNVCREQGGSVVFVTGIEAAREYLVEQVEAARGGAK